VIYHVDKLLLKSCPNHEGCVAASGESKFVYLIKAGCQELIQSYF
jgi:hypothetical protein